MEETEDKIEFTIKNKPIKFKAAVAFTVTSVALAFALALIIIAFKIYVKVPFIWFVEVIPAVALGFSVLELFTYYREEFSLKDGEFHYIKVFNKEIIIKAGTLSCVYMRAFGHNTIIEFVNKKSDKIATITDDGTILQGGIFVNALEKLGIEVKGDGYGDE